MWTSSFNWISLFFIFLFLFTACNSPPGGMSKSKSSINPDLNFSGIDFVDSLTDSTATLNWSHAVGVSVYQIFQVKGKELIYIDSVNAPTEAYTLTGLSSNQEYVYFVRAFDSKGESDNNTKSISLTTSLAPSTPSVISLSSPTTSPGFSDTPTITVSGVKEGDTVSLYTDSNCSTHVGTAVSSGSSVEVTTSSLTPATYTFYARSTGENSSECSTANVVYERTTCPIGFVPVPANPVVGVSNNFCVMKYEAKAWNDTNTDGVIDAGEVDADGCAEGACSSGNWASIPIHKPVSQEDGLPWRQISQQQAILACDALNDIGETNYTLISNPEWMAIARNIEAQNSNWSGGMVGAGRLFQGNNGSNSASSYDNGAPEGGSGRDLKAMHVLSNGEEVWDLSANAAEWVNWEITPANKAYFSGDGAPASAWREFPQLDTLIGTADELYPESWQPANSIFDSNQGVGRYAAGNNSSGGTASRGGDWGRGADAGVYALGLSDSSTVPRSYIGFRCVYRP